MAAETETLRTRYITFTPGHPHGWVITNNRSGETIGYVVWYPAWRQYCFRADLEAIWNKDCLRTIADFCERRTTERKGARARA